MASGTIALTRTGSGYLTGQMVWSSKSNGTEANTSTVTVQLQIQRSALNTTTGTFKGTLKVGTTSETISWYGSLPSMEWVTVKTLTVTVSHNADGKGSCYLYAIVNGPTQTTMEGTYVSGSATVTLEAIPRFASIISATNFTDEENPTITYSNPAGTAVSSLQACISLTGSNADVPYRDIPKVGTRYTFSLTEAERKTLREAATNSNTLTVKVVVRSQVGDTLQTDSVKSKMTVVNANPALSYKVEDTNEATKALTGDPSVLVALHSKAKVTINATAKKYATIKSKKVLHSAAALSGDGTLSVTNHAIVITVTDSRGNTVTRTAANTIVAYINPTCTIGNQIPQADGSFTLNAAGVFYNGAIGKTANAIEVQYRCKAAGGSYGSWTKFGTVTKSGNSYTATADLTGLDYQTVYTFQARVKDVLHESGVVSAEKSVIAEPVYHWGQNDFHFNVPVSLKDGCDILKNGSAAYAPAGYGYGEQAINLGSFDNETDLTSAIEAVYGGMKASETKMVRFQGHPAESDFNFYGILARSSANYGSLFVNSAYCNGSLMQKVKYAGTWKPLEWVNPTMYLGVQYRTSERYRGKIVYAKLVNFGALPNNTTKNVAYCGSGSTGVVSMTCMLSDGCCISSGYNRDRNFATSSGLYLDNTLYNIRIFTEFDMSSLTAYALVKYTID